MRFEHLKSLYLSGTVFVLLFFVGYILSQHKLLWIDECYSEHVSVESPSYMDILTLHFPDGNKCPLFYINQKIFSDIFSFHYPGRKAEGSYDVSDVRSQIFLRIPSNFYMSLSLACIFYYFTRFFSLFTAIYALLVALVSPMVWMYWVEARPYSLWFLLTTFQLLLYCSTVHYPKVKVGKFISLTHFLLILNSPGSIVQVTIIAALLCLKKGYKKRQLILTWALPLCIFLVYYFLVPVYKFKTFSFYNCLFEAVMPERLFVYVIYALTAWMMSRRKKESSSNTFFLPVFLLFLISGTSVLFINLFTDVYQFHFSSRYLIYLVPADILMFSLASHSLWQWSRKNIWVCMNLGIFLGGLMLVRALLTYREILLMAIYLHTPMKI